MRIDRLSLKAYGPFTDVELELPAPPSGFGLHLLVGANETGKSVALRALIGLLFGIEPRCPDNFIHDYGSLRIGARLSRRGGHSLSFMRRKGLRNTLLTEDGDAVLPDEVLAPFLGEVDSQMFVRTFGIDSRRLEAGGLEMARGEGQLGEVLFAAGLGGLGLRDTLGYLEEQCRSLFLPSGSKPPINRDLARYKKLSREVRDHSLAASTWLESHGQLKDLEEELAALNRQAEELASGRSRHDRIGRCLPRLARRLDLQEQIANHASTRLLPAEFSTRRLAAQEQLRSARERQEEIEKSLETLRQEIEETPVPQEILEVGESIEELHRRLEGYRKTCAARPETEAAFEQRREESRRLLQELGLEVIPGEVDSIRLTSLHRTRLRRLIQHHHALFQEATRCSTEGRKKKLLRDQARQRFDRGPAALDTSELSLAVERISAAGRLEENTRRLLAQLEHATEEASNQLPALGLWHGELADVVKLEVPLSETVDRFEKELAALERAQLRAAEQGEECMRELGAVEEELATLERGGAVPCEEDLELARSSRDEGWAWVKRVWLEGEEYPALLTPFDPEVSLPEAYEERVRETDSTGDRLRREAQRVAARNSLLARRDQLKARRGAGVTSREELDAQRDAFSRRWEEVWRPLGFEPTSPTEMRGWLGRFEVLAGQVCRLDKLRSEMAQVAAETAAASAELTAHLEAAGTSFDAPSPTLESLLERCRHFISEQQTVRTASDKAEDNLARLNDEVAQLALGESNAHRELGRWGEEWKKALGEAGLGEGLDVEETGIFLETHEALFKAADETARLSSDLARMVAEIHEFEKEVEVLTVRLKDRRFVGIPGETVLALHAELTTARQNQTRLSELARKKKELEEGWQKAVVQKESGERSLTDLCRLAGTEDPDKLVEAEEESRRLRRLQEKLAELEQELGEDGGGRTIEELTAESAGMDIDAVNGILAKLAQESIRLDEQRAEVNRRIGALRKEAELREGSSAAAESAQEVQAMIAQLRVNSERYIRLRLAQRVLQLEIDHYRRENQNSLLTRASELFSALTCGSFDGLRADLNEKDEQILTCIRPGGETVDLSGLSDGSRDQLFLALRLASVERYLSTNEPMPFIVDDILVNFDDHRAATTFRILADLSQKTQVVFFTHHTHNIEVARRAAGKRAIHVIEM